MSCTVVVFGDPFNSRAVGTVPSSKVLKICHAQDVICTGSGGFTTHLNYNIDAQTSANYVIARV
jgi:cutinase